MFYHCAYNEITEWKVQGQRTYAVVKIWEQKHDRERKVTIEWHVILRTEQRWRECVYYNKWYKLLRHHHTVSMTVHQCTFLTGHVTRSDLLRPVWNPGLSQVVFRWVIFSSSKQTCGSTGTNKPKQSPCFSFGAITMRLIRLPGLSAETFDIVSQTHVFSGSAVFRKPVSVKEL